MCGVAAIFNFKSVAMLLYEALLILQHRGQDAAGILTCSKHRLFYRKSNGLVRDVFREQHIKKLQGNWGIGHVRYPTTGCYRSSEAQPMYVNSPLGIALAHNGRLTNNKQLLKTLFYVDRRHVNSGSDSEVLLNVFAHELFNTLQGEVTPSPSTIFYAVEQVHRRCRGAYAAVALLAGLGILGFRDPYGIRPLIFGKKKTPKGTAYMFASESVALTSLGFQVVRDLKPGEIIFVDTNGTPHFHAPATPHKQHSCIFEYVYFARPDSVLDGVFVHKARMKMGEFLADKIKRKWPDYKIDVVVPIPDTSKTAAVECAVHLKVKYREGFIKNRYIGRTFIMARQDERKLSVLRKLNPIPSEFKNKSVLLVDDSIVRGTTSKEIVQMVRGAGAKKVYFVSASPPILHPNLYGIDIPSYKELVAHKRNIQQISKYIHADRVFYQDLRSLKRSIKELNPQLNAFETSIFDGKYIV